MKVGDSLFFLASFSSGFSFLLSVFCVGHQRKGSSLPSEEERVVFSVNCFAGCFYSLKMGFWTLIEAFLLFANALAILNEDRFLARRGWTLAEISGGGRKSLKGQVVGLIHACQFLRLPLMILNVITIVLKLFSG